MSCGSWTHTLFQLSSHLKEVKLESCTQSFLTNIILYIFYNEYIEGQRLVEALKDALLKKDGAENAKQQQQQQNTIPP